MAIALLGSVAACTDPSPSREPQITPCEIADPGRSDFLPPDVTGEIQHTDGSGGLLFDSLESALCDGFERVVVEFDRVVPDSGAPGRLGLAAEWVDEVILDGSGAVQPIGGSEILQLSVLGATWQPGTGSSHSVSGPHDLVAEARFNDVALAAIWRGSVDAQWRACWMGDQPTLKIPAGSKAVWSVAVHSSNAGRPSFVGVCGRASPGG
ncbi:AMIN-like domain-containing (lipo)protein [Pseudactinotalea terrae]|uniref:AMIN-like domain-containing (lipo)protein n=1 Tax=Pseudactinotalea terrae TaxID=1743262 RepID=UPI003BABF46C